MIHRRRVLVGAAAAACLYPQIPQTTSWAASTLPDSSAGIFDYILKSKGKFDADLYRKLLGNANEFKEGDLTLGIAAEGDSQRAFARSLLLNTTVGEIDSHPPHMDDLLRYCNSALDEEKQNAIKKLTLQQLKDFLVSKDESDIRAIQRGLSSDVIACLVRLMSNQELIEVASKVFNPLPGSDVGRRGFMGARVQPNSPTDDVDDIQWQVFNAFAFAVGDVLLGTNPVSSTPESVAKVEAALLDIVMTFELTEILPHCVLSHIDVQAQVERQSPGSTALWFQSIAGNDACNATFDVSVQKMIDHARSKKGKFGLYFETGQGADFTNGHGFGVDMVLFESRKYGFARALTKTLAEANGESSSVPPWVHVNDVAGFIGPEVFRTKEQLVRCCLEDIVMGKLHGLTIGLDICTTLHMDVTLQDLGWCIEQVMPACPAYLMALPTRIDPMLGYLTTGFHDHVRVREKFGFRVSRPMWSFYQSIGVIDDSGKPTSHFGDPAWVYCQYRKRKGDARSVAELNDEAREKMAEVRGRGVFLASGYGESITELPAALNREVNHIYEDAKKCIWAEFNGAFVKSIPRAVPLHTLSKDRNDYILHPASGESLSTDSIQTLEALKSARTKNYDCQIVVSDGLNATALTGDDQLLELVKYLQLELEKHKFVVAPERIVVTSGRVRAGYQIGSLLFGEQRNAEEKDAKGTIGKGTVGTLLHIIGERPGSGHRTMSIYMTSVDARSWGTPGTVDHHLTKVVSGIANTALKPAEAARQAVALLL
ncbi:MAG: ethanolamine ammonia-lyase subunit EutB [Pirellula sp.]|jgi:ethanolamine ammonia-lyase large subunit|nr:ethanolamine ammonia-lyase subunit EutB [Pirellula sp.]